MPITFIIPGAILVLAVAAVVIAMAYEYAYEKGYDDACRDWRSTRLYRDDAIEAEVVEDVDGLHAWCEANAARSTAYPPSMN
jgi:hypothetical protein